jgi:hypothetical protein
MTEKHEIESDLEAFLGGQDPQEIKSVPWPTMPQKLVGLRPLTQSQMRDADAKARKWATETGIPHVAQVRDPESGNLRPWTVRDDPEVAIVFAAELVARALVDPKSDPPKSICPGGGAELSMKARRETIAILMRKLSDWTEQTSPIEPQEWTEEILDQILETLGKGLGAILLQDCGPAMLRALLLRSVAPRTPSTGSTSSTTTPSSASGDPTPA